MRTHLRLTLLSLSVSLALAACGGGGGGSETAAAGTGNQNTGTGTNNGAQNGNTNGNGTGNTAPSGTFPSTTASTVMTCPPPGAYDQGTTVQCSGTDVAVSADKGNGVLVTNSGVQAYGKSTVDKPTSAEGFALDTTGLAEVRIFKGANNVSKPALLLSNLGIKWDGTNERPTIIERFLSTQGRTSLGADRSILVDALPTDTAFFTFDATKRSDVQFQSHFANNSYFPRATASTCPTGTSCPPASTAGSVTFTAGNWQTGGTDADLTTAGRMHEDGDVHVLQGVPFPGAKGYRDFANYSYRYANMAKWLSQDTVEIAEWTGAAQVNEHTQNRRGAVAYGAVTDPATVPTTGTATYKGWLYGWYASTAKDPDPAPFRAEVTITADFAARTVKVTTINGVNVAATPNAPLALLNFTSTVAMGAANTKLANYMTGALTSGSLTGGLGGRYFGPIESGVGGNGPAEIGGAIRMQDAATGAALVGGFVGIKRNL